MSLNSFNSPLSLRIEPSYQKWALILVPHFLALLMAALLEVFNPISKILIIILVCISSVYYIRLHIRKTLKKSVQRIYQDSNKNWFIDVNDTDYEYIKKEVRLLDSSFISQFIIIMNLLDDNNISYTALIAPDSLPKDEFRRLVVRFRML